LAHCTALLYCQSAPHRALRSFPTRRSSDLAADVGEQLREVARGVEADRDAPFAARAVDLQRQRGSIGAERRRLGGRREQRREPRSEEHTSELQSRENLVCRLLLEKKKLHI